MKWIAGWLVIILAANTLATERSNPFADPNAELENMEVGATGAGVSFVLKAVMPSDHNPLANIDGEILGVGEEYKGYLVKKISSESVELMRGTSSVELMLASSRNAEEFAVE